MTTAVSALRRRYHRCSTNLYGPSPRVTTLSWLGDERVAAGCVPTATTLYQLPQHGVTHIVNCRSVAQTWLSQDLALERKLLGSHRVAHAPMWDTGRAQPHELWSAAAVFAAEALATDPTARVLIHCQQGRRRSVLVAYAVLRLRGHSRSAAAELVTRHRREAVLVEAYVNSVEGWLANDR